VGLLYAYSAFLRGTSKVYSVGRVPQRFANAKSIGAIPIDFSKGDRAAQIMKHEPEGVDRACDCIEFECVDAKGVSVENLVLTQAINVVRTGGGIGVIVVYIPMDLLKPIVYSIPQSRTG
jgi:threonine dehydrogenase-like Zn-dependent dehydrogenase